LSGIRLRAAYSPHPFARSRIQSRNVHRKGERVASEQAVVGLDNLSVRLHCRTKPAVADSYRPGFPTVVFTSAYWKADPSYYSIAIDSTGTATYYSAPDEVTKTGVPYIVEFHASNRILRMTFNIAAHPEIFAAETDPTTSADAMPVRTLFYGGFQFHHQITYSAAPNSDVDELTSIFEEISETLEFGRRLSYFHQHDRSALDQELDLLQKSAAARRLREVDVIRPVLRRIDDDPAVEAGTRRKAEALLNSGSTK